MPLLSIPGDRLWISASWPVVFLLVVAAASMVWELVRSRFAKTPAVIAGRGNNAAVRAGIVALPMKPSFWIWAGLQRIVPLTLGLTFLLVPSTSTRIFKTFLCDRIEYDSFEIRRYLHDDLATSCDSDEYTDTRRVAIGALVVWPVGTPALYALLLWVSRDALQTGISTRLSRATSFLTGDEMNSLDLKRGSHSTQGSVLHSGACSQVIILRRLSGGSHSKCAASLR